MRSTTLTVSAAAAILSFAGAVNAVTGQLGDAPVVVNQPKYPIYVASFTNTSTVTGTVHFRGSENGTGILVTVDLQNFPQEFGGPFPYHVHTSKVVDGNCTTAMGHLDPYVRGEQPPCDSTQPQTCQVGDLSGKHGKVKAGTVNFTTSYVDAYASVTPDTVSFVGNRSVVVHLNNTLRIACANIEVVNSPSTPASNVTTGTGANYSSPAVPSPSANSAAVSGKAISGFLLAVSAAAVSMFAL